MSDKMQETHGNSGICNNMVNITSVITDPEVGGTFLSWTIHYLAGHNTTYNALDNQWIPIPNNPVSKINAHNFKSNHPWTRDQFDKTLDSLQNTKTSSFHTLYLHELAQGPEETKIAYNKLKQVSNKTVLVTGIDQYPLYRCSYTKRHKIRTAAGQLLSSGDDFYKYEVETYFKDSADIWESLNLTNVWDKREFMALNQRPFIVPSVKEGFDFTQTHFRLEPIQLWTDLESKLDSLFEFKEVSLNKDRLAKWVPVYHQWRKIHSNRLSFIWYFEDILEYIINGYHMDLTHFNLDISQEAAIQHALLYKHNLNLKTWQLEKFIDTKQLHNLLEPNIYHKLT